MILSSRFFFWSALALVALMLALGLFLATSSLTGNQASALSSTDWEKVRGYIDDYISSQYVATDDGEAGFLIDSGSGSCPGTETLKRKLDSDCDGNFLDDGDDAALAPTVVDMLGGLTTWIPGTSYRRADNNWFNAAGTTDSTNVKTWVQKREAAGFNYDIVSYCGTGRTESPPAMAYGVMAQAGYFGTASPPAVFDLKWGRAGWSTSTSITYTNSKPYTASTLAGASNSTQPAGSATCNSLSGDAELARCVANEALPLINSNGGTGSGILNGWASGSDASYAPVDIRTTLSGGTLANNSSATYTVHIPLDQLFDVSLANLNKLDMGGTVTNVFVNRTMHSALFAATGAQMLGYKSEALAYGLPSWNKDNPPGWQEKWTAGAGYPVGSTAIDTTAPSFTSGPTVSNITSTSADIGRITNESATSKIDLTGSDSSTANVNDTILNADKTATGVGPTTVTGLNPGVTYTGTLTVCDGLANCTSSAVSFTTTCTSGQPTLSLGLPSSTWASWEDYVAKLVSATWTVNNLGASTAFDVQIASSTSTWPSITTVTAMPVSLGNIAAGSSASTVIKYQLPVGFSAPKFRVVNTASAEDECGTVYTYP